MRWNDKTKENFEIWQNLKRKRMKWNVKNNFIKKILKMKIWKNGFGKK